MSDKSRPAGKTAARRVPHLVGAFETREFGSHGVRIGDFNGDGAPELLFAQTLDIAKPGTKELQCNTPYSVIIEQALNHFSLTSWYSYFRQKYCSKPMNCSLGGV